MKLELWFPVKPKIINQAFGNANDFYFKNGINIIGHNGIDFYASDNQPIHAAHAGVVTFTGEDGKAGLGVVIRTEEEFDYKSVPTYFKTIYWHCKPNTFKVKPGDKVNAGDILAHADNTGLSTGTHLHFGLKPVGQGEQEWEWFNLEQDNGYLGSIDPASYFNGFYAEDAVKVASIFQQIIDLLTNFLKGLKK